MDDLRTLKLTNEVHSAARSLSGVADVDPVLELIGDASLVLLGEATHGTREFYQTRAAITRRLIAERGFDAVAVEGDWPDCYRVNRYVRGLGDDDSAEAALGDFRRFPCWMWRNTVVRELVEWLRESNADRPQAQRAGFYGLDMYSLYASLEAVLKYLDQVDPEAARVARERYGCLEELGEDPGQNYGHGVRLGLRESCEDEVIAQLEELRRSRDEYLHRQGMEAADAHFAAEQNARVVESAESYFRNLFTLAESTWNVRDQHMCDTLAALRRHLSERLGRPARIVVWEHNSHIGDARASEMGRYGEHNLGQLARQRFGDEAVLIGFTTYHGTVSAASQWDGPLECKRVRPALPESYEHLFHQVGIERFFLPIRGSPAAAGLGEPRLERAIGVIYRPETERHSHYFHSTLARRFDGVVHFDRTDALEPLDPGPFWRLGEAGQGRPVCD